MSFSISCPECDARLTVPDNFAGKKLRCKKCDAVFLANRPGTSAEAKSSKRSEDDDDERPRRRRPDDDDEPRTRGDDDDESLRSRRRRDADDDDDRPRRKVGGKKGRNKSSGKEAKKSHGVAYILGLIAAFILLGGAVVFLGWRAGVFGSREPKKELVADDKEPEFLAPDARIGELRKETTGPDGERAAAKQRVKLSMELKPMADGTTQVVLSYEMLVGAEMPPTNRLVVMESDRMHVLDVKPEPNASDRRLGAYTFQMSAEEKQKYKKFWIALLSKPDDDVKTRGLRVSNTIALP